MTTYPLEISAPATFRPGLPEGEPVVTGGAYAQVLWTGTGSLNIWVHTAIGLTIATLSLSLFVGFIVCASWPIYVGPGSIAISQVYIAAASIRNIQKPYPIEKHEDIYAKEAMLRMLL